MTIEEKAKTYDEALERAKEIHENEMSSTTTITCCEEIFPELKESEDEKIRKELIEQVAYIVPNSTETDADGNITSDYYKRIEKYRTYLAGRKEQQSTEWSEEDENMRYKATTILNKLCASNKEFVWQHETLIKIFYWLKYLCSKPYWKPSVVQMEALKNAKMQMSKIGYGSCPVLQSLITDLQKLL